MVHILDQNGTPLLQETLEESGMQYCFTLADTEGLTDLNIQILALHGGTFLIDNPTLHSTCTQGVQVANVRSTQDYYPFGMVMPGRNYQGAEGYRYGFNGKEMDNEVSGNGNQYDYGFRIYNPRLGKFLSVDPLTAEYPWYTPYQFAGNKPIIAIDLDGLEEWIVNDGRGGSANIYGPYINQKSAQEAFDYNNSHISLKGNCLKINSDGFVESILVQQAQINNSEKGNLVSVKAIILHRTVSSTAESAVNEFRRSGKGVHFLIDENGQIKQLASLNKHTVHLFTRLLIPGAPGNNETIGIETVGMPLDKNGNPTLGGNGNNPVERWENLTGEQINSLVFLVNSLFITYDLGRDELLNHEDIQPKTPGEGGTVRNAIEPLLIPEFEAEPSDNDNDSDQNKGT